MVMIVGIVLLISVGEEGIIERANEAKHQAELGELKEKIGLEYIGLKNNEENKGKTTAELFTMLDQKMNLDEEHIGNECMIINLDQDRVITLLEDGTILEGRMAVLDIADGNIDIRSNGYIQGARELQTPGNYRIIGDIVEYTGDYIITGTSDENLVRVMEKGTYNITIKDLNLTGKEICAFNLNRNTISTDVFVNLYIEGNNYLYGEGSVALGFTGGTPNVNGVTNGSTLTIQGTGSLYAEGGKFCAGIGSGYTGFDAAARDANNITINSGNITAIGGMNGCGIGGGHNKNVNNIIINGGNIEVNSQRGKGIGACNNGISNNIIINGGIIKSNTTKTAGQGI